MDGRRFRRWCLYGGLLAGAAGCHRNNYQDTFGFPKAGQPVGAVVPGGKPSWGGGTPPAAGSTDVTGMQVDPVPVKKSKGGFSPETKVAFADVWVEAAFADPPPVNRDQLIDQARQGYQKVLDKDSKNEGALLGMARLYARLGDREHAMEYFKKYLSHKPKDHKVAHEIAITHGRWKDWDGAAAWCDQALKTDSQNREYRKTKAFCLARAGKWEDAFKTLQTIMTDAEARYLMARVLAHQNHPDHCRLQLELALKEDPNFAPARELMASLDNPNPAPTAADGDQVLPAGFSQPDAP
jgi:tetratricopeptide (TPR) repeat protein